jgi:hypothetical protein
MGILLRGPQERFNPQIHTEANNEERLRNQKENF